MLTLKRLYLEPDDIDGYTFEPITFERGLNVILGASSLDIKTSTQTRKMNGVGKSMLIQMIEYCLLNDLSKNRLSKLPIDLMDERTRFCLDIEYEDSSHQIRAVTIKRDRLLSGSKVLIIDEGEDLDFDSLTDARHYLERYFIIARSDTSPSLRSLLSIVIRDENSSYDNVFYPTSESKRFNFTDLIKPHLYLFGANLDILTDIRRQIDEIKANERALQALRSDLSSMNIPVKEIKSYINELDNKVSKLNLSVESLKPAEASTMKKDELADLLVQLDQYTTRSAALEYRLKKIADLPQAKPVNTKELKEVYNYYKNGLGDLVANSFENVLAFRKEVDSFQQDLMQNKQQEIRAELHEVKKGIQSLDTKISAIYSLTDAKSRIDDLASAVVKLRETDSELEKLKSLYEILQSKQDEIKQQKKVYEELVDNLDGNLFELSKVVDSFEKDLVVMHEAIAGNRQCQFEIKIDKEHASYVDVNYRIKLDGSAGINRIKTFMYDTLLMLNKHTSIRHPGFLIHDNIFASSGRDDMVKSLNYLGQQERTKDFQYIITINSDEFDAAKNEFTFEFDKKISKILTREKPLLGREYYET